MSGEETNFSACAAMSFSGDKAGLNGTAKENYSSGDKVAGKSVVQEEAPIVEESVVQEEAPIVEESVVQEDVSVAEKSERQEELFVTGKSEVQEKVTKAGRGGKRVGAGRPGSNSKLLTFRAPGPMAAVIEAQENKTEFLKQCVSAYLSSQNSAQHPTNAATPHLGSVATAHEREQGGGSVTAQQGGGSATALHQQCSAGSAREQCGLDVASQRMKTGVVLSIGQSEMLNGKSEVVKGQGDVGSARGQGGVEGSATLHQQCSAGSAREQQGVAGLATAHRGGESVETAHQQGEVYPATAIADLELPFFNISVAAGFPIPLDNDEKAQSIHLLKMLCPHQESSYLIKVKGNSMIDADIHDGDIVIVDKSKRNPSESEVALCEFNGEYTLKRFIKKGDVGWLVPANPEFPEIKVTPQDDFSVWGTVTYVIHKPVF